MRFLFLILCLGVRAITFGQYSDSVRLRWNVAPRDTLQFLTSMQEVDSAAHFSVELGGLFGLLTEVDGNDSPGDLAERFKSQFAEINRKAERTPIITRLFPVHRGLLKVEMQMLPRVPTGNSKKDSLEKMESDLMQTLNGAIALRGLISDSGHIESFYVKNDQRNLLALFFELPPCAVRVGDSWPLDVHFLSMDQNFNCDSFYRRNRVTLLALRNEGGSKVAVLRYDIHEYISGAFAGAFVNTSRNTTVEMSYRGLAEFSISRGTWLSYQALASLKSSGVMESATTKRFTLKEVAR